jgi:hypothetical protein
VGGAGRPPHCSPHCEGDWLASARLARHDYRMLNGRMTIARALALSSLATLFWPAAPAPAGEARPRVVVELFTSEGCSSCPPADTYLGELAQRPDVLALAFHVDYWNYIGWTDPYASKLATQRQHDYARNLNLRYVYTPQMVVNGTTEGVGSERLVIAPLIKAAEDEKALSQPVSIERKADGALAVHVDAGAGAEPATLWLVGFDREHATPVLRGENAGRTLKEYQVVRSFEAIGTWRGPALDLMLAADRVASEGGVAVLLQQGGTGRIIGAALLKPPTS